MKCKHLEENNQNYFQHLRDAWSFGYQSFCASMCFFFHGLSPWNFKTAGSDKITILMEQINRKKARVRTITEPVATTNVESVPSSDEEYQADDEGNT